ncbi:MAG: SPW repeat protein [Burkholderiales bacterium]|nr:SPW repeat protein [Burkholderiales bacterium]
MATQIKHWQDPANAVLGAWLIVSPWVLGFGETLAPTLNAVILGFAILAVALFAIYRAEAGEAWATFILGLWLVISPWALRFASADTPRTDAMIVGVLVAALSIWTLLRSGHLGGGEHGTGAAA